MSPDRDPVRYIDRIWISFPIRLFPTRDRGYVYAGELTAGDVMWLDARDRELFFQEKERSV